jgi:hypothetical protein
MQFLTPDCEHNNEYNQLPIYVLPPSGDLGDLKFTAPVQVTG